MESVLFALWIAAAPAAELPASSSLDLRCFQLMAELAEDEDPRLRSTGRIAAQYFLGRLDAVAPGAALPPPESAAASEREELLNQCAAAMGSGGRDFRSLGESLAPRSRPAA
jgi:hypothetical protein